MWCAWCSSGCSLLIDDDEGAERHLAELFEGVGRDAYAAVADGLAEHRGVRPAVQGDGAGTAAVGVEGVAVRCPAAGSAASSSGRSSTIEPSRKVRPIGVGVSGAPTATLHEPTSSPSRRSSRRRDPTCTRTRYGVCRSSSCAVFSQPVDAVGPRRQQHLRPAVLAVDHREPRVVHLLRRDLGERPAAGCGVHRQRAARVDDVAVGGAGGSVSSGAFGSFAFVVDATSCVRSTSARARALAGSSPQDVRPGDEQRRRSRAAARPRRARSALLVLSWIRHEVPPL